MVIQCGISKEEEAWRTSKQTGSYHDHLNYKKALDSVEFCKVGEGQYRKYSLIQNVGDDPKALHKYVKRKKN